MASSALTGDSRPDAAADPAADSAADSAAESDALAADQRSRAERAGLQRIVGIVSALVGTQAATSVLGALFWLIATQQLTVEAVGTGQAAVSLMSLLASFGSIGLGTLLIARIPHMDQGNRRATVRTALAAAGAVTLLLAVLVPVVAIHVLGADNLRPVGGAPADLTVFAVGTALMSVAVVLDQAVLVLATGRLQLERNIVASVVKIVALLVLVGAGQRGGMTIFAAWTIGTVLSLPVLSLRTRGGWALQQDRALVRPSLLKGLGRSAAGHHALNTVLQVPLTLLPVIVTVVLGVADNGIFSPALQVTGFVFALPYAVSLSLFAAAEGRSHEVVQRMRLTIPFALAVSLLADAVLYPLAPFVLRIFGAAYSEQGTTILRLIVLAGLPFVIKDHFVALRRVEGRTLAATSVLGGFAVVELVAAVIGARTGGTEGLVLGWLAVLAVEAVVLAVPLVRAVRGRAARPADPADPTGDESLHEALFDTGSAGATDPTDTHALQALALAATDVAAPAAAPVADGTRADGSVKQGDDEHGALPDELAAVPTDGAGATPGRWRRLTAAVGVGPVLLLMSLGTVAVARGADLARVQGDSSAAQGWYVGGLLLVLVPAAVGILLPRTPDVVRVVLAVVMPLLLQLSRTVLYPTSFMFHDELLHANVLRLITASQRLYADNPLLPITSDYPGMEVATNAVQELTGLAPHTSAVVVLTLTRVVLALGVVAVVQRATRSTRAGAVAGLVYACNPQFLFFNSQYSYQTLALPLAVLSIHLFLVRRRGHRLSLALPVLAVAATCLTHHVTSALLVAAWCAWALLELVLRRHRPHQLRSLTVMAGASLVCFALPLLKPGNTLGSYLGSIVVSSVTDLQSLAQGQQTKKVFQNSAGVGTAPWEQVAIIASLALTMLVLVPALLRARVWARHRVTFAVLLCLVAILYPVIPGGHLTRATAEVGDRAAGFVFLGVAFVVAWWLCRRRLRVWQSLALAVGAAITFTGSVILGAGPVSQQLPGPYQVSSDARSIDSDNLAAAQWLSSNLPAGTRVYADRVGGLLAAAVGRQYTVRHISTDVDASRLLLDPQFGQADLDVIRAAGIRYVVVDRRDANGLPNQGVYVESGEFGGDARTRPVPRAATTKLDRVDGVQRLYDNGSVAVYDVRALDAAS